MVLADAIGAASARTQTNRRPAAEPRGAWPFAVVLLLLTFTAYANSLRAPFVLDDEPAIVANPTIRSLAASPFPPHGGGLTVEGRPVLNLSFALNARVSGLRPEAFRLVNVAIHAGAGLLLFGLVRRSLAGDIGARDGYAFAGAALWLLHPLGTGAVTYIVQRAESLCACLFLLAMYAVVRAATTDGRAAYAWKAVAVIACFLGVATKEVMAAAPVAALLYDRAFAAGSFREAWRRRGGLYLGMAASWLLLAALVFAFHGRSGSAGFSAGVAPWQYLLTQCSALVRYATLCVWPFPLVFDYGTSIVRDFRAVAPAATAIVLVLAITVVALVRTPRIGFLLAAIFLVLAPSSSVVPVATQTIAEHRMYLPLAAVLIGLGWVGATLVGRRIVLVGLTAAVAAATATAARNAVYRDALGLWQDTVAKRPDNTRALNNLALLLRERGHLREALRHLDAALALEPGSVAMHNNHANLLADLGRFDEACVEIDNVIRAAPLLGEAHDTRADILRALGRNAEAAASAARAVELNPALARRAGSGPRARRRRRATFVDTQTPFTTKTGVKKTPTTKIP